MIAGVIVTIINILIVASIFVFMHVLWKSKRPTAYHRGVGIRCNGNAAIWPDTYSVIDSITAVLESTYGKQETDKLLTRLIIEIVPGHSRRMTPFACVSEATRIAGSVDTEKKYPWSTKHYVAVVLQRKKYVLASQSAIAHEIMLHILPFHLKKGWNASHSSEEFEKLFSSVKSSFNT